MVHRDHINLTTTLFYSSLLLPVSIPAVSTLGGYAYIPFLFGSLLPDLDISLYDQGHRYKSPAHNLGYALLATAVFAAAAFFFKQTYPAKALVDTGSVSALLNNFGIYKLLVVCSLICAGWCAHLCGDFIQGGVKFFGSKIGFRGLTWDVYYGPSTSLFNLTCVGSWLGWVLLAATYGALFYAWLNRELSIAPAAAYFTCAAASGCGKAVASLCALCTAICAGVLFTGALPFDVLAFL